MKLKLDEQFPGTIPENLVGLRFNWANGLGQVDSCIDKDGYLELHFSRECLPHEEELEGELTPLFVNTWKENNRVHTLIALSESAVVSLMAIIANLDELDAPTIATSISITPLVDHVPDIIDEITKGSWMEGKRPCSECSFVISNQEADTNGGPCDRCMAAQKPEYDQHDQHHYFDVEMWKEDVADGSTHRGYADWVQNLIEQKSEELSNLEEEASTMEPGDDLKSTIENIALIQQINELRTQLDPDFENDETTV